MGKQDTEQARTERLKIYGGIIIAILTLIGTLAGAGVFKMFQPKETPAPVQVAYDGYVYEANGRKPMQFITVNLELQGGDKKEATTDSEGKYLFDLVVTSRVAGKINVNVEGYHPFTRNVTIPTQDTREPDILLTQISAPVPATETAAPTPTEVIITETPTEAPTQAPTEPPVVAVKTIPEGCISAQTWSYDSNQADVKNSVTESDGCYSTGQLGIFTDSSGILNILLEQNKTRNSIASGIYTSATLPNPATIEFTVTVKNMYLVPPAVTPTYITFSIASANDPMNKQQTARFKFQVNSQQDTAVYAKIAPSGALDGSPAKKGKKYTYPTTTYTLVVDGKAMNVYTGSGDNKIQLTTTDVALPVGPYVFYIGYELPVGALIDADVTNIKINGQPQ